LLTRSTKPAPWLSKTLRWFEEFFADEDVGGDLEQEVNDSMERVQGLYLAAQEGIQQSRKVKLFSTCSQFFFSLLVPAAATHIDVSCWCSQNHSGGTSWRREATRHRGHLRRASEAHRFTLKRISSKIHEAFRRDVNPDREGGLSDPGAYSLAALHVGQCRFVADSISLLPAHAMC